jgi:hypothetical protein
MASDGRAPGGHAVGVDGDPNARPLGRRSVWARTSTIGAGSLEAPAIIAETLARLGIESTGPPKRRQSSGGLDYVYDV